MYGHRVKRNRGLFFTVAENVLVAVTTNEVNYVYPLGFGATSVHSTLWYGV